MPPIFRTKSDYPHDVEIAMVGTLAGNARGGITVERAAQYLHELQDKNGRPLTGQALRKAAEEFAESRGFEVRDLKNVDEQKLRVEAGGFPSSPSIEEVSRTLSERDFGRAAQHADEEEPPPALRPEDLPPQATQIAPQPPGQEG